MKKNNKGFTLIELLAVIVVLAIIMVIATTQINGVIRKNRVDSFLSTYKIAMNAAKTCAVQQISDTTDGSSTACSDSVDYSKNEYDLKIVATDTTYEEYKITLTAQSDSEFDSINIRSYYSTNGAIAKELGTNETKLKNITTNPPAADTENITGKRSLSAEYTVN